MKSIFVFLIPNILNISDALITKYALDNIPQASEMNPVYLLFWSIEHFLIFKVSILLLLTSYLFYKDALSNKFLLIILFIYIPVILNNLYVVFFKYN